MKSTASPVSNSVSITSFTKCVFNEYCVPGNYMTLCKLNISEPVSF